MSKKRPTSWSSGHKYSCKELLESDKKKPPVPAMIRTIGFPIEGFCYLNELEEIFRKHLPEQPKQ
jgi:hypothetical protein